MARKCPDCAEGRLNRTKELTVCPECQYREISPDVDKNWLVNLSRDTKLWDKQVTEAVPFLLVNQYEEIQAMAAQGSGYKTLHSLHELIRLLIRFPVLCAAAVLEDPRVDALLTEKELSMENWARIAQAEIDIPAGKAPGTLPAPLSELLVKTLRLFREHGLAESRPEYFAASSRTFLESKELISFVEKTLFYIARYFKDTRRCFAQIEFELKKQNGVGGKVQENILLTVNEFKGTVQPYILLRQDEIFFFEGMNQNRKRAVYRNFTTGILHERADSQFSKATLQSHDVLAPLRPKDALTLSEAEARVLEQSSHFDYVPCEEFEEWLRASLKDRGVLLYQAPALSGKSVLCDALSKDAPAGRAIQLDEVETAVYRCDSRTTASPGAFISGLYYSLTDRPVSDYAEDEISETLDKQTRLSLDGPESMAALLNEYKRSCKHKLLVVIDGLDQIQPKAGTIFDCIPGKEELAEGIFILLTCREPNPKEENEAFLRFLERSFDAVRIVRKNSPEFETMVRRYIGARVRVRVGRKWRKLNEAETLHLMQLSDCRISSIRLYSVMLSAGTAVEDLPLPHKLFDSYISASREAMGARHFRPTIRILAAVASAVEPISIPELCGLFEYNGIPRPVLTRLEEISPFLRVVVEGGALRVTLSDPELKNKILGIFPEMIGDVVGHVALRVLDATEEEMENPNSLGQYCFAYMIDYIRIYGNKSMLDVLCKHKIYYKLIQLSKLLFTGSMRSIFRREALLTSALILLKHSTGRDVLRATTFNTRGNFYVSLARYRDARDDYSSSIKLGEKCSREFQLNNENILAGTYINRGAVHRILGQLDDAVADYTRAIELRKRLLRSRQLSDEKELAAVYQGLAQVFSDKEQYDQAVENYSYAIEIWESLYEKGFYTDAYALSSAYYTRSMMLNLEGRTFEEIMDYSRAIELLAKQKKLDFSEKGLLRTLYLRRAELHEGLDNREAAEKDKERAEQLQ